MSVQRGTVFNRTRFIPTLAASISNSSLAYKLKRIIGTFGKIFLKADDATKPLIPGIDKSIVITSGLICWASSMASVPFAASPHVLKPSDRNAAASNFRIGALSSTTKTVLPIPRFPGSVSTSKVPLSTAYCKSPSPLSTVNQVFPVNMTSVSLRNTNVIKGRCRIASEWRWLVNAGKRLRSLCRDVVLTTPSVFGQQLRICREEYRRRHQK